MASLFKSTTTYDPIFALLNAETEQHRDRLTEKWRDHKLEELNFIGIVGALLAGVLTSTGSWPSILPNGTVQPWTVRACWYVGIVFALFSVLVAAQQSVRLHRLSCHERHNIMIRRLLAQKHRDIRTGYRLPRQTQVYFWQLSVLFLIFSVLAMFVGMFILTWSGFVGTKGQGDWWNEEAKLGVVFTVCFGLVAGSFLGGSVSIYSWEGEDDEDERC